MTATAWFASPVLAASSQYDCGLGGMLEGQFTPRLAQVQLTPTAGAAPQKWTLTRLPEAGLARYKLAGGEVQLTLSRSQAELTLGTQTPLVCKLKLGEFTSRPSGR